MLSHFKREREKKKEDWNKVLVAVVVYTACWCVNASVAVICDRGYFYRLIQKLVITSDMKITLLIHGKRFCIPPHG